MIRATSRAGNLVFIRGSILENHLTGDEPMQFPALANQQSSGEINSFALAMDCRFRAGRNDGNRLARQPIVALILANENGKRLLDALSQNEAKMRRQAN